VARIRAAATAVVTWLGAVTMSGLAKYAMSYTWDASKHPRGDRGRFGSGTGSSSAGAPAAPSALEVPSRSLTRGESWQQLGSKLPGLPVAYTGSKDKALPADWFAAPPKIAWQVPASMMLNQHIATLGKLKQVIRSNRDGAIEKAKVTRQNVAVHGMKDRFTLKRRTGDLILDPEAPKGAVNRAYNHAAMLALHDFGALDYDFKMSDPQKEELTPLVPFMRFVRRRLGSEMRSGDLKGATAPYRAAFGTPFADSRTDKQTGAVRLRVRPNDQMVKALLTEADVRAAARSAEVPTPAQAKAGNYSMGHLTIGGLPVSIETPKGRMRRGTGPTGKKWSVKMPAHYGYVKRTVGADGDHVDVYLGPHAHEAPRHPVFVVDQVNARTKAFDEHKAMVGFPDHAAATSTYDAAFSDGRGPDRRAVVTKLSFPAFRTWVRSGDTKTPIADQDAGSMTKRASDTRGCVDSRVAGMAQHAHRILHRAGTAAAGRATDPHVASVMPDVRRLLGTMRVPTPRSRRERTAMVADHSLPLAHALTP
jgi:hypothetical protein